MIYLTNRKRGDRIVHSWDTASETKGDNSYTVCTAWLARDGEYFLLHVERVRVSFPGLISIFKEKCRRDQPDLVLIENASSGKQLFQVCQDQKLLSRYNISAVTPKGTKEERWASALLDFQDLRVNLPRKAAWLDTYLDEILNFPDCKFSDQVDSTSQFLLWMRKHGIPVARQMDAPLARCIKAGQGYKPLPQANGIYRVAGGAAVRACSSYNKGGIPRSHRIRRI